MGKKVHNFNGNKPGAGKSKLVSVASACASGILNGAAGAFAADSTAVQELMQSSDWKGFNMSPVFDTTGADEGKGVVVLGDGASIGNVVASLRSKAASGACVVVGPSDVVSRTLSLIEDVVDSTASIAAWVEKHAGAPGVLGGFVNAPLGVAWDATSAAGQAVVLGDSKPDPTFQEFQDMILKEFCEANGIDPGIPYPVLLELSKLGKLKREEDGSITLVPAFDMTAMTRDERVAKLMDESRLHFKKRRLVVAWHDTQYQDFLTQNKLPSAAVRRLRTEIDILGVRDVTIFTLPRWWDDRNLKYALNDAVRSQGVKLVHLKEGQCYGMDSLPQEFFA